MIGSAVPLRAGAGLRVLGLFVERRLRCRLPGSMRSTIFHVFLFASAGVDSTYADRYRNDGGSGPTAEGGNRPVSPLARGLHFRSLRCKSCHRNPPCVPSCLSCPVAAAHKHESPFSWRKHYSSVAIPPLYIIIHPFPCRIRLHRLSRGECQLAPVSTDPETRVTPRQWSALG